MSILTDADAIINGDRQSDYGHPRENFENIAAIWSVLLGTKIEWHQVASCMVALKLARLINNPMHEDSWKDIAGYVGTWELGKNVGK